MAAYSVFGTARLTELDLFYIFAAQIARLFTFEHAVRLFSVLMAAGLFYLIFCNLKKNRWLLAVMFLTPQIWYLYTYYTLGRHGLRGGRAGALSGGETGQYVAEALQTGREESRLVAGIASGLFVFQYFHVQTELLCVRHLCLLYVAGGSLHSSLRRRKRTG